MCTRRRIEENLWRDRRRQRIRQSSPGYDSEITADRCLAFLVSYFDFTLDYLLAVLFAFVRHFATAGKCVAGPYLTGKPDLKAADIPRSGIVSQASRQASGGPHTLSENGGNPGGLDKGLIVMQRDEIPGGSGVPHEVRARDIIDCHCRE
jgi:hypothetical protein